MIISRTPLRISFAGGGSDLPSFYQSEPGAVFTTSINKYVYITVNRKFDSKFERATRLPNRYSAADLRHELIREALGLVGVNGRGRDHVHFRCPFRRNRTWLVELYTVGLLNALYAFNAKFVDAERLGREACEIEIGAMRQADRQTGSIHRCLWWTAVHPIWRRWWASTSTQSSVAPKPRTDSSNRY